MFAERTQLRFNDIIFSYDMIHVRRAHTTPAAICCSSETPVWGRVETCEQLQFTEKLEINQNES